MKCKSSSEKNIIFLIKGILKLILIISIVLELAIFPSWENFYGCIMMLISYFIFNHIFLKRNIIINFPFAFIMFLSIFMYRFLPVPATLLEGIPVSYGMEVPIKTFILETVLFLVSSCSFYFSILNCKGNNIIQKIFKTVGVYKTVNRRALWIIGIFGCIARITTFSMGSIEFGNVFGKVLMPFSSFMYIPMILFFPGFYSGEYEKNPNFKQSTIWLYLIFISILNFASNSRESLIEPIATIALLYIAYLCINNTSVKNIVNIKRLAPIIVLAFISIRLLSSASEAILSIRNIRSDISFTKLIELTFENMIKSESDRNFNNVNNFDVNSYEEGWTEEYLSNFVLNRYANMRISDETLYLAERIEDNNTNIMREDFIERLILILPQPLIDILGFNINKNNYQFSRGDALYVFSGIGNSYNLGGYRVTSHIGDGIATFKFLYFPLQFIVFFLIFKLLNCYSYRDKENNIKYSIYGLYCLYTCLNIFRNANGIIGDISFIIRGYWQELLLFVIVFAFARFISVIRIK